jgi:hypothetical protein
VAYKLVRDFVNRIKIEELQSVYIHKNFESAYAILNSLLEKNVPKMSDLERIYGSKADLVARQSDKFLAKNHASLGNSLREHHPDAPTELADAMFDLQVSDEYAAEIELAIHNREKLNQLSINKRYGGYAGSVDNLILSYAKELKDRGSLLAEETHPWYVSEIVYRITGSLDAAIKAIYHDHIEDNLLRKIDPETNKRYTLADHDRFVNEEIPKEFQKDVKIMTNYYGLIIKYIDKILERRNRRLNRETALVELEILMDEKIGSLTIPILKLYQKAYNSEVKGDYSKGLRWICYDSPYMDDGAAACYLGNTEDYRIKGVDVKFNSLGKIFRGAIPDIQNINKQASWVNHGYALGLKDEKLNNNIMEAGEDMLVSAEYWMLKMINSTPINFAYFKSMTEHLLLLTPVLYTDVKFESILR